jgi:hypothetical protein
MKRMVALLVAGSVTACAPALPVARRPIDPDLQLGALAHRTAFEVEEDSLASAPGDDGPASAPVDVGDPATDAGGTSTTDTDTDTAQRQRNALVWSGVALMALGGAGTIGFSTAGQITESRLDGAYASGLSRDRDERLRDAGLLSNRLAYASASIGVIGLALLAIGYGLDYTVCGALSKKRKKCRNR